LKNYFAGSKVKNMKARDIFGIIVRSIGICAMLYSLWYLAFGVAVLVGLLADERHTTEEGAYFISGIVGFVVGIVLLRFGREIVRFSYPNDKNDSDV
jgi:hypothetical protein